MRNFQPGLKILFDRHVVAWELKGHNVPHMIPR